MNAKHIGHNVVVYGNSTILEIIQSSCSDGDVCYPAQSITINGLDGVINLRNFCNDLLKDACPVEEVK